MYRIRRVKVALLTTLLLLLAACGGPAPEPTAVPGPTSAALGPSSPASQPTVTLEPTTAPTNVAPAPSSTTSAPTAAASLTPSAIPAPSTRASQLGTFFFYWYNCPRRECDASQLSVIPPGWLAPLPNDGDPRDGTAYSSINYDWFEGELRDIAGVGIDTIFPVSWGEHPHFWFRQDRLDVLVQANGVLEQPLQIGMFLDSTAQQGMYNDFVDAGYRFGPNVPRMPLSDPRSGYFFYDRHIKGFWERIPREMWATVNGRPIIVTYTALCCNDLQRSGALWAAVKSAFERDFGVEPWLILEDTWFAPEALAPPPDMLPVDQAADGRYSWGTALNGPSTQTLGDYAVSSVGPGFDNRLITGIVEPRWQPRDEGAFLRASLAAVPPEADLTLIETWNEWPESTGVARAAHLGAAGQPLPEDFYMEIIRAWWASRQAAGAQ